MYPAPENHYTPNLYVCITYYINSNHESGKNINCKGMDICMRVNEGLQTRDNDGYFDCKSDPRGPEGAWISNLASRMAIPRCRVAMTSPASNRSPSMLCDKGSLTSEHFFNPKLKLLFPTLICSLHLAEKHVDSGLHAWSKRKHAASLIIFLPKNARPVLNRTQGRGPILYRLANIANGVDGGVSIGVSVGAWLQGAASGRLVIV